MRTRIKICGLTREQDVEAAVAAGADAIGFVLWSQSPRAVSVARAAELARRAGPLVSVVGLFVNATRAEVAAAAGAIGLTHLQFHGDETIDDCLGWDRPVLKAVRLGPNRSFAASTVGLPTGMAILVDADHVGFGGSGQVFDWSTVPDQRDHPLILAGGLHAGNVGEGIRRLRPWAVDVSSGVELLASDGRSIKGVKSPERINAFVAAVAAADHGA